MSDVKSYIDENRQRFLDGMVEFLKIPSISSDSTHNADTRRAAEWILKGLSDIGIENTRLIETGGHPVVYGDWLHAPDAPTILIYGHYDVQPVDPLDKWNTKPFEPTIIGDRIFARGASDDKGQLVTHLFALEALFKTSGRLPVNVKFFIEGEEEAGSAHTAPFVINNKELLKCDAIVISDTAWYSATIPTIVYALRGLCYLEFIVKGPNRDLHSGVYGGKVQNPLNAMARIISKLQDEDGKILVPGFYDDVLPLTDDERKEFAAIGDHDAELMKDIGVDALWGEKGYTSTERNWARPSMDVNGIWGGFSGEGAKTVIPSMGGFKVSSRLVPNQTVDKTRNLIESYVRKVAPPGVTIESIFHHGGEPVMIPTDNFFMECARQAFESVFGKRPLLVREGASIPITATFVQELKAPPILLGYGLPDDNIHAPNEKLDLPNFYGGILTNALMYQRFGGM